MTSISTPARPGSPSGFPIVGDSSQKEHHSPGDSLNRILASKYPYVVANLPRVVKKPVRLTSFSVYVLICSIPFVTTTASGVLSASRRGPDMAVQREASSDEPSNSSLHT